MEQTVNSDIKVNSMSMKTIVKDMTMKGKSIRNSPPMQEVSKSIQPDCYSN